MCPSALSELKTIKTSLGEQGKKVQAFFVSVDPERDTPEVLAAYMANFGDDFTGVSLGDEELKQAAKAFKCFIKRPLGPRQRVMGSSTRLGFMSTTPRANCVCLCAMAHLQTV